MGPPPLHNYCGIPSKDTSLYSCLLNAQFTIKPVDKKTNTFEFNSSRLRVSKLVSSAETIGSFLVAKEGENRLQ